MIHVFTIAGLNYLPQVRLLCHSLRKFHPEFVIHLGLVDRQPEWLRTETEPFDHIIHVEQLPIENFKQWAFFHDITELSTAIRPFILKKLLQLEGCTGVLYFDPDIVVFSPLHDLVQQLLHASILLTPHQVTPEQSLASIQENEIGSLQAGIFNLGFFGVSPTQQGHAFADWWAHRLYHFCINDIPAGLFVDQKWVDFVPVYFDDVVILKSPRFNVAMWNIMTRTISGNFQDGFFVNGEPLGFYHFSRFRWDSYKLLFMLLHYQKTYASLLRLVDWYEAEANTKENIQLSKLPWCYGYYDNGKMISKNERQLFRNNIALRQSILDPFAATAEEQTILRGLLSQPPPEPLQSLEKEWRLKRCLLFPFRKVAKHFES